jgi:hypothetical protein
MKDSTSYFRRHDDGDPIDRITELEIQASYEVRRFNESINCLSKEIRNSDEKESLKFKDLSKKVSVLIFVAIAQVAGLDMLELVKLFM